MKLENSVRHSSTHAAGVVISNEPLEKMIPLYKGSKDEIVTQYDMNAVEELGFVKFDFLGLKTLTVIKKAKDFIRLNNEDIDNEISTADLNDPKIYELLSKGLTRGIFQIESSGMKDVLKNLKADKFDDIVALLALYRPGPLDSGMVDEYILRKNGKKKMIWLDKYHCKLLIVVVGLLDWLARKELIISNHIFLKFMRRPLLTKIFLDRLV